MQPRCCDCGFLALIHSESQTIWPSDEDFRRTGKLPTEARAVGSSTFSVTSVACDRHPICFVNAFDFKEEMSEKPSVDELAFEIKRDRDCESFMQLRRGFTPAEHDKIRRELKAEERQLNREKESQKFQAEQAEFARRHNWRTLIVALVGIVVSAIGLIVNTWINTRPKPPTVIQVQMPSSQASGTSP
jgi:hypothetical protein